MRVLVADDEYYARKALLKILAELDVEVAADMETGQEVIDYLERDSRVDAVLTDIRMPEMNGLQVAEHISRSYPDVSVIIVTGYADFSYAQQALRFGVKDYVTKPLRRDSEKSAGWRICVQMPQRALDWLPDRNGIWNSPWSSSL